MIILMEKLNNFLIIVKNYIKNYPNRIVLMVYFLLVLPFINELIFKYGEGTFYLYYILGGILVSFTRRMLEFIWIKAKTKR